MEKQIEKLKFILDRVIKQAVKARNELGKMDSKTVEIENWEPSFPNLEENLGIVNTSLKGTSLGGKVVDKVYIYEGRLRVEWKWKSL